MIYRTYCTSQSSSSMTALQEFQNLLQQTYEERLHPCRGHLTRSLDKRNRKTETNSSPEEIKNLILLRIITSIVIVDDNSRISVLIEHEAEYKDNKNMKMQLNCQLVIKKSSIQTLKKKIFWGKIKISILSLKKLNRLNQLEQVSIHHKSASCQPKTWDFFLKVTHHTTNFEIHTKYKQSIQHLNLSNCGKMQKLRLLCLLLLPANRFIIKVTNYYDHLPSPTLIMW